MLVSAFAGARRGKGGGACCLRACRRAEVSFFQLRRLHVASLNSASLKRRLIRKKFGAGFSGLEVAFLQGFFEKACAGRGILRGKTW